MYFSSAGKPMYGRPPNAAASNSLMILLLSLGSSKNRTWLVPHASTMTHLSATVWMWWGASFVSICWIVLRVFMSRTVTPPENRTPSAEVWKFGRAEPAGI